MNKIELKQQQEQSWVEMVEVVKALPGSSPFLVGMPQYRGSEASERQFTAISDYLGVEDGKPYSPASRKLWHSPASPSATAGKT